LYRRAPRAATEASDAGEPRRITCRPGLLYFAGIRGQSDSRDTTPGRAPARRTFTCRLERNPGTTIRTHTDPWTTRTRRTRTRRTRTTKISTTSGRTRTTEEDDDFEDDDFEDEDDDLDDLENEDEDDDELADEDDEDDDE
jgi:hypothetical protein